MDDIFDYLKWRGDLDFGAVPVSGADHMIFCCLSYIPFDGILDSAADGQYMKLGRAAGEVLARAGARDRTGQKDKAGLKDRTGQKDKAGLEDETGQDNMPEPVKFHLESDKKLLRYIAESHRYRDIRAGHFVDIFSVDLQEQFCGVTFILPNGDIVVSFRGTDGTIIGWKEDFNMGFLDCLPSQSDAVIYLTDTASALSGDIYVCGHSKGGNLAMYSSAFSAPEVRERIREIRNLDGPGFKSRITDSEGYKSVVERMRTFIPQGSIVGMILEHPERTTVVRSRARGTGQHDIYSWEISRDGFAEADSLSNQSILANKALNEWVEKMSDEKRMKLTDGIYSLIENSEIKTLEELFEARNLFAIMRKYGRLDDETKELVSETGRIFMDAVRRGRKEQKGKESKAGKELTGTKGKEE